MRCTICKRKYLGTRLDYVKQGGKPYCMICVEQGKLPKK